MPERRKRSELKKFPAALRRRLAAEGYKIERRYVNLPSIADMFRAIERAEPIWVHQCWLIVRKTRQRARKRAQAPTEMDAKAQLAPFGKVEEEKDRSETL